MRIALFLAGLFLAGSALADIGSVTEFSGTAIIKRGSNSISISKGTIVVMNDKVETKNGKVKITFKDDTTVNVTESSTLVIDDFVYDPKSKAGKLNLRAAVGTVRYASGNIAHNNPNAVNIKTPTASIAVRGTDFVMAVNEIGGSMIMLMPSCETESINLKGIVCGSGAIDVETPAGIIKMNKPYQATLVETSTQAPSPPIIVNLNGMGIGNNLMINPPTTMSGTNVVNAARAAAVATGDIKKDDVKKEDKDVEKQQAATTQDNANKDKETANTSLVTVEQTVEPIVIETTTNSNSTPENEFVSKLYKDKSETQQIGWQYEALSTNKKNYANIVLPIDTKVQVVVSQDMQVNSYNWGSGSKAQGTITIVQQFR